ncbi:MAG: ABC transporter permease [Azonexus sp.]|jgi:ABC-2 type transport system permease protein|nr:ABC transporter permease [Azonexus sp.]
MPRLLALWLKETIALSRDRHGLLALFIMPVIFILIMTLALRDAFSPGVSIDVAYSIVDLDHSRHSASLIERLDKISTFKRAAAGNDAEAARAGILQGRQGLALIVPAGFGKRLLTSSGGEQPDQQLLLLVEPTLNPALQQAFRNQVMAALGALRADALMRRAGSLLGLPPANASGGEGAWPDDIRSEAVRGDRSAELPSSVQQNVPAWLIFAMFFVVIPLSSIFVTERQHGTLQRLRAIGLPFHLVLTGKLLPFFVVNQIQALAMLLVGIYIVPLFGAEALHLPSGWPQLAGLALVSLCVSLAAVSLALLIATLARTAEQATIVGGVGNILMGAIGGIMVPRFVMPAGMQTLTDWSPMAWGLEGFHTVMLRHGGISDLSPSLVRLLAFAVIALVAAVWLNHREQLVRS